jgi:hypothetical protein
MQHKNLSYYYFSCIIIYYLIHSNSVISKIGVLHGWSFVQGACSRQDWFIWCLQSCAGLNNHIVYESTFVAAFQPSGWMDPFVLHGQCSIWNKQCHDKIVLKQECVLSILFHETNICLVLWWVLYMLIASSNLLSMMTWKKAWLNICHFSFLKRRPKTSMWLYFSSYNFQ